MQTFKTPTSARVSALFASSPSASTFVFLLLVLKVCLVYLLVRFHFSTAPLYFLGSSSPLSPLYIPSMFTLVSLASPCGSVAANICVVVDAAPYFQRFIILISPPTLPTNSSFISLHPLYPLLSNRSALLCLRISNNKAEN